MAFTMSLNSRSAAYAAVDARVQAMKTVRRVRMSFLFRAGAAGAALVRAPRADLHPGNAEAAAKVAQNVRLERPPDADDSQRSWLGRDHLETGDLPAIASNEDIRINAVFLTSSANDPE